MTNEERIQKKLEGTEFIMGGFNDKMELLNIGNLKKVMKDMLYGSTDIDVFVNRKPYVVEVSHVDNEIDFGIITKEEYINRYGSERYDRD